MAGNGGKREVVHRPQGTPNKVTAQLREVLSGIVEDELNNLPETLKSVDPKDRAKIVIGLLPYVAPRLQNITIAPDQDVIIPAISYVLAENDDLEKLTPSEKETYRKLKEKCKSGEGIHIEI